MVLYFGIIELPSTLVVVVREGGILTEFVCVHTVHSGNIFYVESSVCITGLGALLTNDFHDVGLHDQTQG